MHAKLMLLLCLYGESDMSSGIILFNNDVLPRLNSAKSLLKTINDNFGTLTFCRRYLDRIGERNYLLAVSSVILHCNARAQFIISS